MNDYTHLRLIEEKDAEIAALREDARVMAEGIIEAHEERACKKAQRIYLAFKLIDLTCPCDVCNLARKYTTENRFDK